MPFATEFDDVYASIKATVEQAATGTNGRCFRLDENRPAGRITDRLITELKSANLCIADLTDTKPNVMWELGFAMALDKPTIIITQSNVPLPFDIKDMQSIQYHRNHLSTTLNSHLKQSILDTLSSLATKKYEEKNTSSNESVLVGTMLTEISQLKEMVAEAVRTWKTDDAKSPQLQLELEALTGHWFNAESGSHNYMRVIHNELVSPYCYGGNEELTGVYFGWRRTGEYWFTRYKWISVNLSGFSFLRMKSIDLLNGAWWSSKDEITDANTPPPSAGVTATWIRQPDTKIPSWAEAFFDEVEREGLASCLTKIRQG
jgi:nucleoside 2-deoxyribosyltransferase